MAVPVRRAPAPDPRLEAAVARAQLLADRTAAFRAALEVYRFDHGRAAGYGPPEPGAPVRPPSFVDLRNQMLQGSNARGATGPAGLGNQGRWPLGPYLPDGLPVNPLNGLATVRVLADGEPFPAEADGTTGWIYQPAQALLRANAVGTLPGADLRYYDL
jgi:hypothetical protein